MSCSSELPFACLPKSKRLHFQLKGKELCFGLATFHLVYNPNIPTACRLLELILLWFLVSSMSQCPDGQLQFRLTSYMPYIILDLLWWFISLCLHACGDANQELAEIISGFITDVMERVHLIISHKKKVQMSSAKFKSLHNSPPFPSFLGSGDKWEMGIESNLFWVWLNYYRWK